VLLAGVGLRGVEPELEEAALLDLPAWRVLVRVTLRRGVGAIAGAALAVAVLTAGDMTVTDLLVVRTYAEEAYVQYQLGHGPGAAAAVALPPVIVLGGLVFLACGALLRADPARVPSADTRVRLWRLGRWRVVLGGAAWATVGNVVALPIYALIWRAGPRGGRGGLRPRAALVAARPGRDARRAGREVAGPLLGTMLWAGVGASATVALAWPLAWKARRPGPWRWAAAASVALALAAPGPVAGMALVLAYRDVPPVYDTPAKVVLGYVLRTLPYAVLVLWPAPAADPRGPARRGEPGGLRPVGPGPAGGPPPVPRGAGGGLGRRVRAGPGGTARDELAEVPGSEPLSVFVWGLLHTGVESQLAGIGLVMLAAFAAAGLLAAGALRWAYFGPDE
jgi:iron(III) transport system permease protein